LLLHSWLLGNIIDISFGGCDCLTPLLLLLLLFSWFWSCSVHRHCCFLHGSSRGHLASSLLLLFHSWLWSSSAIVVSVTSFMVMVTWCHKVLYLKYLCHCCCCFLRGCAHLVPLLLSMLLLFSEQQCIASLSCFVQVWDIACGAQVGASILTFDHIRIGKCFFFNVDFLNKFFIFILIF